MWSRLPRTSCTRQGVSENELEAGGWTVTLNLDKKKQKALEKAVRTELTDNLDPKKRQVDKDAQVGAVSVDPKTGGIVAMYGGAGYTEHYTNNATRPDYQPASTFKPLILASAYENGSTTQDGTPITANTLYDGTSKRPVKGSVTAFAPPNEDDKSYGPINVQKAMNKSVNSVYAQMAVDVGLDKVKSTAMDLGMNGDVKNGFDVRPAMSLGVMGASPKEMAGVYATLDNHGKKVTPAFVKSAEKGEDQQAELPDPTNGQAISRGAADSVTQVLTGVVDDGTGQAVRTQGQEMAGKTGTSDDNKSAWFTGYTPDLVTSVGMFGEAKGGKQVTLKGLAGGGRVNGGDYPARIWSSFMGSTLDDDSTTKFDLDTELDNAAPPPPTTESEEPPTTSAPPTESESPTPSKSPTPDDTPTAPTTPATPSTPPSTPPTAPTFSPPATLPGGENDGGGDDGQVGG